MKIVTKTIVIRAAPPVVFAYMDAIGNTGAHMMNDSSMMMGSGLQLKQLSANATGPDARYRWSGKVMGFPMDFTVVVTKWLKDYEKIWETTGHPKMLILSWYQMQLLVRPGSDQYQSTVSLCIRYKRPKPLFWRIVSFLLADWYANWCVNSMLQDSKIALESRPVT